MSIIEKSKKDVEDLVHSISVLVVTATDLETREVIRNLRPFPDEKAIAQVFIDNQTYYLGILGIYGVVVVQSEMGSVGRNSSLITTLRAADIWNPKAIIMVGIAFGIDSEKQHIGDVIVSSHIIPYEIARIGQIPIYRSELPPASTLLLNRARQIRDWKFLNSRATFAKTYIGPILSGEKLIDSAQFKNVLIKSFPNAIGGEMESVGVYSAANEKKLDWIVIKGICDFADGFKNTNKEEYQTIAIKSAVSFTQRLLSIKTGFLDLGFQKLIEIGQREPGSPNVLKDLLALFDAVTEKTDSILSQTFKVAARQVVQTEVDTSYENETAILQMLIPKEILTSFENRISYCWNRFNEVLSSPDSYLPAEVDSATLGVQHCVCRELNRLLHLNGQLPEGTLRDYWNQYNCGSKVKPIA